MAEIFETKERTRTEAKKQGEGDFAFYDSAGGAAYDAYRALLDGWLSELPEADRAEMVVRCQKGTDLQYKAALAELTTQAALKRQGYVMEIHPKCEHLSRGRRRAPSPRGEQIQQQWQTRPRTACRY